MAAAKQTKIFTFSWAVFWSTAAALTVATLLLIPQLGKLMSQAMSKSGASQGRQNNRGRK